MTINEKVFQALEATDLNWTIDKIQYPAPEGREQPRSCGTYKGSQYLGTVGMNYQLVQNSELAEIFIGALEALDVETTIKGGHFAKHRKVYLQAVLPDRIVGPDKLKRNLTALNSHDGSTSVSFGTTNTVVICQNTFYMAFKGMRKMRHTAKVIDKIKMTSENLYKALEMESEMMGNFDRMAAEMITPETVQGLIKQIFEVDADQRLDLISTVKANQIKAFSNAVALETRPDRHGKTVWGLFNAVTYYTNHVAKPEKYSSQEYLMAQKGYSTNNKAYSFLTEQLTTVLN